MEQSLTERGDAILLKMKGTDLYFLQQDGANKWATALERA